MWKIESDKYGLDEGCNGIDTRELQRDNLVVLYFWAYTLSCMYYIEQLRCMCYIEQKPQANLDKKWPHNTFLLVGNIRGPTGKMRNNIEYGYLKESVFKNIRGPTEKILKIFIRDFLHRKSGLLNWIYYVKFVGP